MSLTQYQITHMENRMLVDSEWPDFYDCSDEPEYEEEYRQPYDFDDEDAFEEDDINDFD